MSGVKTISEILLEIKKHSTQPSNVHLLAVTKKQPVEKIQKLIAQGQNLFGENYVQEALEKMELLPRNIRWHLIGHLQSKKVNSIIGKFECIHSVDSLKLACLISEKSIAVGIVQNIFIEVNLGDELSKTGFDLVELRSSWSQIAGLEGLRIWGLMALPPPSDDDQVIRVHFGNLRCLLSEMRAASDSRKHPMNELSMGTSQDYQIALEEGSTFIRIGTILFGERL